MTSKLLSLAALAIAVIGLVYLIMTERLFHSNPASILVQAGAVVLMVWARKTLGWRSFHATANPTSGPLITTGPYRWWRHPIYAAIVYFTWAGVLPQLSVETAAAACLVTGGLLVRMTLEERFLVQKYPEYETYRKSTRRLVPFIV